MLYALTRLVLFSKTGVQTPITFMRIMLKAIHSSTHSFAHRSVVVLFPIHNTELETDLLVIFPTPFNTVKNKKNSKLAKYRKVKRKEEKKERQKEGTQIQLKTQRNKIRKVPRAVAKSQQHEQVTKASANFFLPSNTLHFFYEVRSKNHIVVLAKPLAMALRREFRMERRNTVCKESKQDGVFILASRRPLS